jgi:hypothetical protein
VLRAQATRLKREGLVCSMAAGLRIDCLLKREVIAGLTAARGSIFATEPPPSASPH